jgi:hydrogenase maturation protease
MSGPRILIAGIGNIFLGDDAFGVEVARRLSWRAWPDGVRVADFGIRGFDLAYALLDDYDAAILVDATSQGGDPGTIYTIELECGGENEGPKAVEMETHGMNPMRVLEMAHALGGQPRRILVVGCEPETFGDQEEGALGLSATVEAAVDVAIGVIDRLVAKIGCEHRAGVPA